MPATRSKSSASTSEAQDKKRDADEESAPATPRKRAKTTATKETTPKTPRTPRKTTSAAATTPSTPAVPLEYVDVPRGPEPELVPAKLTFDLVKAKEHLIAFDSRFEALFERRACKPYVNLATVDPFRTLASAIISQQIATKAARAIQHKFCRLYDQSLTEKYEDGQTYPLFPTASQVCKTSVSALRSAGLSARKAEYLQDLAAHFSDGRITTQKLVDADDDGLSELLIPVKGIGPWTVQMFAIFSLRHPDIMPAGDLGVQRGLARWALAAHSPKDAVTVAKDDEDTTAPTAEGAARATTEEPDAASLLPAPGTPKQISAELQEDNGVLPQPFTPSINRVLAQSADVFSPPFDLPDGLTTATLRGRLNGKAKKCVA